jgi:hypothetical protein
MYGRANLTHQLTGIASYAFTGYLYDLDKALRVNNKGSPVRQRTRSLYASTLPVLVGQIVVLLGRVHTDPLTVPEYKLS